MLRNEGNLFYTGDFDESLEDMMIPLIQEIQKQKVLKYGRIDLYINSFGGYAHVVNALVELVENAKSEDITVRTIVPSIAFSAGSMLAIAGTPGHRYIARTAEHLVHYGNIGSSESTPTQVERYNKWKTRDFKNTLAHYKKYCNIPNIEEHLKDDGYFVTASEAIKWGLADHYMNKLDIGEYTE